jgi:CRISPR type IV-associated protein Csf3
MPLPRLRRKSATVCAPCSMRSTEPLRVDFELGGMMAVPEKHPPLLDALLLARLGLRLPLPFPADAIPVATVTDRKWPEGSFCWLASALHIDWVGPAVDRVLHRNARPMELLDDAGGHNATSVDFDRGLTKVTRKRMSVRQAVKASAWCIGDQDNVATLLNDLQALGAHRHHGLGIVRSVSVERDTAALKMAWWRPLPAAHAKDPFAGLRFRASGRASPPYWDRDLSLQAWWPTAQVLPSP